MSEQNKKTKKILLIGNGFDLRTGVKTTFRDFFRFVIYGVIWHNYNKSELLKYVTSAEISAEIDYERYFNEQIQNKVEVIADIHRENEIKNWRKESPGKELPPSKHPLEILLEIEKEEKENGEKETVFDCCREFIDTEFGQCFFKHILNCDYLYQALRINLNKDMNDTEARNYDHWTAIYGITNKKPKKNNDYISEDTKLGKGLETIAHIYEAYLDKNWSNIALWSDVETVIELLITGDENLTTKYNVSKNELPKWNDETLKSFSEGLDIFELLLTKYLDTITRKLDIEKRFGSALDFLESIYSAHVTSMRKRCLIRVSQKLFMGSGDLLEILKNPDVVINYNYTDIAERIYKNIANPIHIHINGEINHRFGVEPSDEGFTTNIVIGYTNHNNNDVPKDLYHFEKLCRRIVKNPEFLSLDFHLKDFDNFDLLIIGHSCCTADSDVIGSLLEHDKLRNALILCHTKDDLISINNNIRHILKPEKKYSELMTHNVGVRNHNLFYAVERPKEENKNQESKKKSLVQVQRKASLREIIGKLLTRRSRKIVKTAQ